MFSCNEAGKPKGNGHIGGISGSKCRVFKTGGNGHICFSQNDIIRLKIDMLPVATSFQAKISCQIISQNVRVCVGCAN